MSAVLPSGASGGGKARPRRQLPCLYACGKLVSRRGRRCRSCAKLDYNPGVILARAANQKRAAARVLLEVLEACRPHVDDAGCIPLKVAVRLIRQYRREGYQRGWGLAWHRFRRQAGAPSRAGVPTHV